MNHPKDRHIQILDWMRGIAAVLVCASHLRNAMFVEWAGVQDHGLLNRMFYAATALGHQSVMVFFVLSGYLVGGSVIAAGPRFRWPNYAIARLSRLWVVLVPCLVLTLVADSFTASHANDVLTGSFAARWHSAPLAGEYSTSWHTLLGNLAFVQTIAVPVYGSNGPLWSLANEFWYYVMFPLAMIALGRTGDRSTLSRCVCLALLAIVLYWLPIKITAGFLVWVLGALVSYFHNRMHAPMTWHRTLLAVSIAAFVAALGFSEWSGAPAWSLPWRDPALGVAVAAFLLCALQWRAAARSVPRPQAKVSRWVSDISFSLYLSHFPIVMLVGAVFFHDASLQPGPVAWVAFLGILGGLLVVARIVWWLFERHTPRVKNFVTTAFAIGAVGHRANSTGGTGANPDSRSDGRH